MAMFDIFRKNPIPVLFDSFPYEPCGQMYSIKTNVSRVIRWMEEILHQLVYGLSPYNPIIYNVS